jgi:hypothetical protein
MDNVGLKVAAAVVVVFAPAAVTVIAGLTLPIIDVPSKIWMFGVASVIAAFSTPETVAKSEMLLPLGVKDGPLSVVVVLSAVTEMVNGAEIVAG